MFLRRLRDLREDNDKKQGEIAEVLGLKQAQYNRYENGVNEIPLRYLIALADFYGVTIDYIVGVTDNPRRLK